MRGSLGEKIGEGAFADVHAWAPGQVVKLFKAGVPQPVSWWEARMTRTVFAGYVCACETLIPNANIAATAQQKRLVLIASSSLYRLG